MAKTRKTTATVNELFLPSDIKGQARVCVTLLETGVTYCSKGGELKITETDTLSTTAKVAVDVDDDE